MTLYDFKALKPDQQANITWEQGVFLMARADREARYALFQVEGIYVEFHYDSRNNTLSGIKSFINPDLLDPYFEQ